MPQIARTRPVASPRETVNLRVKREDRGLIDRAARTLGKTRTAFMLEASRRAAEEALADQTAFLVSRAAYARFMARLDAPPQPNERLKRTMRSTAPWERG